MHGTLSPLEEASVRVDDHGVVVGDGVFETVATAAGVPFALGRHLDRLRRSAEGMGLHIGLETTRCVVPSPAWWSATARARPASASP